jgi:hydroxymethylpyrimidine/phosphomethylpyrimidine kinase
VFEAGVGSVYPKHGSGCVMASALAANLASGYSLSEAASRAKGYIESFLASNQSLLGWHQV